MPENIEGFLKWFDEHAEENLIAMCTIGGIRHAFLAGWQAAQQTYALDGARVAPYCEHGYNGSCPECSAVQTPPRQ